MTSLPVVLGTLGGLGLIVGPAGLLWLNIRRHPLHAEPRQKAMDRQFPGFRFRVIDEHFYNLLVRPRVLQGKHLPGIGLNQVYERHSVPQLPEVKAAMEAVATEAA